MASSNVQSIKIGVIGAGSWGTALANLLAEKGDQVTLWAKEPEVVKGINQEHRNPLYLKKYQLSAQLKATNDLKEVIKEKDLILSVSPSQFVRDLTKQAVPFLSSDPIIVNASKGIENDSLMTMNEVLREELPKKFHSKLAFLSGPSFAEEVVQKTPTAVTIASQNPNIAEEVQKIFFTEFFRTYTSDDVIGVELGGSLKNVIAIAAGISDGMGLGHNSRAALITRGLGEMTQLGVKMGANPITFLGLAGMGDLILTCTSNMSRNHTVGVKLGEGKRLKEILKEMTMVAEGIKTARSANDLAKRENVELFICQKIYEILYKDANPKEILGEIMSRSLKPEFPWLKNYRKNRRNH